MEEIVPLFFIFVALPWIVFHYITKWKSQATLTEPDEKLLDELHEAARRLPKSWPGSGLRYISILQRRCCAIFVYSTRHWPESTIWYVTP